MDLSFIMEYYMPIVLTASLVIGYVIKNSLNFIPNQYIPFILAVSGAILGCIANKSFALEPMVYGAFSGLASTGLHQAFTRIVEGE